ncbi:MAG: MFS transporter [Armatimonadota bacterium]
MPVLTTFLFGCWGGALGPLLPDIAGAVQMPVDVTGTLISINFAGALVSVMLGGILADRYGKKRVFLVAIGGFAAAAVLFAVGNSYAFIAGACLLGGALGGSLEGLCGAIIADYDPQSSHRNMNLLQIAFSVGAVVALVLTSRLDVEGGAWRIVYLALAITATLVLLLSLFMRVPPAPPDEQISFAVIRRVMMNPLVLLLAVAIAFYVGSEIGLAYWIRVLLEKAGSRPADALLAPGLFWGMTGVGRFISGQLCRRYHGLHVLRWLLVGGLCSYVVLLLPFGQWSLWLGTALAGLAFSGVWPLIVGQGSTHYPAYSGTTVAVLVVAGTLGGVLFPTPAGFAIERGSSWLGILFLGVLFALLTAVIALYARALHAQATATVPASEEA